MTLNTTPITWIEIQTENTSIENLKIHSIKKQGHYRILYDQNGNKHVLYRNPGKLELHVDKDNPSITVELEEKEKQELIAKTENLNIK